MEGNSTLTNAAKYSSYLILALCFVTGMLAGTLLSAARGGRLTILSNNTIGSHNGSRNSAEDVLLGGRKDGAEGKER